MPLIIGAMASVLSLPAATLLQAAGRPGIQAKVALATIVINVPLSLALGPTVTMLARFWPLLLACLCWGALTWLLFGNWLATLAPDIRSSRTTRIYPALAAIAVYVLCVLSMMAIEWRRGALSPEERGWLAKLAALKPVPR